MESIFLPPEVWKSSPPSATPERRRSRRASAAVVDDQLLDAAVAVLAETGPDLWAVQHVAKRAGTTTGAVYARYENASEFAVAVWQQRSSVAVRELLDDVVTLVATEPDQATPELAARIGNAVRVPNDSLRAALALLVVSRRVDVLAEVVVPDLTRWLDEWGVGVATDRTRRAVVIGSISTLLGAALGNVPPGVPKADWPRILPHLAGIARRPSPVPGHPAEPLFVPHPTVDTGDLERDRLIAAAAEAVATVGFVNATVSRVSRRAGALNGSSYRHFPSKQELLVAAIDELLLRHYLSRIVNSAQLYAGAGVDREQWLEVTGGRLAGNLHPERRLLENLRLEVFLAAAYDEELASALSATLHTADETYEATFERLIGPGARRDPAHLLRAVSLGVQYVHQLVSGLDELDWRCFWQSLEPYLVPRAETHGPGRQV